MDQQHAPTRLSLPPGVDAWTLRGVRVPAALVAGGAAPDAEGLASVDLSVRDGRIAAIGPGGGAAPDAAPWLDAAGAVLMPCFVDAHTHLDKGHIAPRTPDADGTFPGALAAVAADREAHWTADDVGTRMEFALRCAYAHGTAAIRTHIDSIGPQTRISWPVFAEARDRWRGRIDLQASPLFPAELALDDAHMADVLDMVGAFGSTLGAVARPGEHLRAGLDRLFRVASDRGFDLDFHADETDDPSSDALATIAEAALAVRFPGAILVGHCCSLATMPDAARDRTIELAARAGLAVVSLPLCNMHLQDRDPGGRRTPRWRGVTALKELRAAGVPVMIASDNTRDPFYAYGDLDMAEVWREGTRTLHLDHPFGDWARTVASGPAAALRRPELGTLRAGGPADFVLFRARSLSELMARPTAARTVVRAGRPIRDEVPDYAALDHLHGLRPA